MIYGLTGHTEGIGKLIYERLGSSCKVFSRSNGFDITLPDDRKRIIDSIDECDVFINNAFANYAQIDLMYELFDRWRDRNKLIVNMGSDTTCGIKKHVHTYTARKAALDKASEQLAHLHAACKVTNLKFGYVGTPKIIEWYNPQEYIHSSDIVDFILDQIKWAQKYRLIEVLIKA